MQCLLIAFLALPAVYATTVCSGTTLIDTATGKPGPCVIGQCPSGFTCLNAGTTAEVCCNTTLATNHANTTCMDKVDPSTGVSTCAANANLCSNSAYYNLMTTQCPKTCGRCTTTTITCVDKVNPTTGVSDCAASAYLCNNSAYYTFMTTQCPKTCGRCSGSTTSTATPNSSCVDKVNPTSGVSDCPASAHLCNNPAYYSLMTTQCPRTCGRCAMGK